MSYVLSWRRPKTDGRPPNFIGRYYYQNPGTNWSHYIPIVDKPINYLEIGVADGGNAIHVANSYCKHSASNIYCVDPWTDYDEYPEYKGQQELGWNTFQRNIRNSGSFEKFKVFRGFSDSILPTFTDNFFDIIYVDGNHEEEFVYKDGVLALQKCKPGGYIIFDDMSWNQTYRGFDKFQNDYKDSIDLISKYTEFHQSIVRKKE
jgi:predicted O-methyltransferase YrrM